MMRPHFLFLLPLSFLLVAADGARAQSPMSSSTDFQQYAIKLREMALLKIEPQVVAPSYGLGGRYQWKRNVRTTIFWVGERSSVRNPVPNYKSSWDAQWARNYGGSDPPDPYAR